MQAEDVDLYASDQWERFDLKFTKIIASLPTSSKHATINNNNNN